MAEAAFITPAVEMLAPTPGTPVTPAPPAAEGIFAGMLAQRLQPAAEPLAKGSVAAAPKSPSAADEGLPSAAPSPQTGNPLPPQGAAAAAVAPVSGLPLPTGLSPAVGDEGKPSMAAQPGMPPEEVPQAGIQADATAPLPAVPLAPPTLDATPRAALAERPAAGDGRVVPSAPPPVAPPLPGPGAIPPLPDPRQRPASLGLNGRGEAAGIPLGHSAGLSAEQALRSGAAAPIIQQTLSGETLSRQFQQQVDRLLASSRAPAGTGPLSTSLPAATDSTTTATPPELSVGAFVLPGAGGEARAMVPAGLAALPAPVINTGVGHPGWSAELGQRMMWLANQEIREAKIQLNPRHLGPIDVRIVYSEAQQVSVSFSAQHPAAREALDAALPRLREMFEQQGLNLADASVSQESFAGQQRDAESDTGLPAHTATAAGTRADDGEDESPQRPPPVIIGQGLLDTFA
ncbi:MAG TPA: flagellar hook-length control protein FliK [Gammaproteobacteria bacterium]|nr:flagellar hook-length control protein FliK [Gammaproteobacteria bacterium]